MKKLLLSLGIGLLSFISFGYCEYVENLVEYIGGTNIVTIPGSSYHTVIELNNSSDYGTYCLDISSMSNDLNFGFGNSLSYNTNLGYSLFSDWGSFYACIYSNQRYVFIYNYYSNSRTITYRLFKLNALLNAQVPIMTSLECQTNYSLVPVSELNSCQSDLSSCGSYLSSCESSLGDCQSNLSTLSGYAFSLEGELNQCTNDLLNCGSSSGSGSCDDGNNWSALYINDIQHLGKPNIFITIPEEINWDYTSEGDDFDLTVSGYNIDAEYIEGVINKQNYIPTTEDLTEVFSNLGSFGGLLVVCLFVILIFYMFKKIFS